MIEKNKIGGIDLFPFLKNVKIQIMMIALSCVGLNINTIRNEYTLDDDLVIGENMNVQMGFAGIGNILSKDSYQGYYDYMGAKNPLIGGRYRPLSIITFAVEQQLFGETSGEEYLEAKKNLTLLQHSSADQNQISEAEAKVTGLSFKIQQQTLELAPIRHLFQIVYFTFSMVVLFWFLHFYLFPKDKSIAFLTTVLFIFHPVHTEVIANLKSRDEIMSLLFILLTCIFIFRYDNKKNTKDLLWGCLSFIGALLSKEYAFILPAILFTGIAVVHQRKLIGIAQSKWFLGLSAITIAFIFIRFSVVGHIKHASRTMDVLNDPYLLASIQQRIATIIQMLDEYLRLLFFPTTYRPK